MSHSPAPLDYGPPQHFVRPGPANTVGLIGFIFVMVSLAGFCFAPLFLLGVVGTVLCGIGLFRRPRGLAIAGFIVGLIEMLFALIVVVFIGMIIGVGVNAAAEAAKMQASSSRGREIQWAIDSYKRSHASALPKSLSDLTDVTDIRDGWGNPIRYVPDARATEYTLISNGRDGKPSTADDMTLYDSSVKPYTTTTIPSMPPARAPTRPTPPTTR